MDPNATLRELEEALRAKDYRTAKDCRGILNDWLIDLGGFAPNWSDYPRAARYMGIEVTA